MKEVGKRCAILLAVWGLGWVSFAESPAQTNETEVTELDTVEVEGTRLSAYRPETVSGGTFTDIAPERLPSVVDTLTEDFIREHNPTDLHDLMRYVPGIETGGKSLLIRQPGTFTIRGMGGTEPTLDGVLPIGRGTGLFMDPFLLDRVEIAKGPMGALAGGGGAIQNASGAGGSVNLYLKSANLERQVRELQVNTSIGRHTERARSMADVNEVFLDGKGAVRLLATADYYEPTYLHEGSQKGARPRESFTVAPSFIFAPTESVQFGLKTLFQSTDQPSYIGVPVWHGRPAGGYGWYESSCRRGDRSHFESFMLNPWLDWHVTDDWQLRFGASLLVSSWSQTTREPYMNNSETNGFFETGLWPSGEKYMLSTFSESASVSRNYNVYMRSIYEKNLGGGVRSSFVVQPDYYYRESSGGFGTGTSRYGLLAQERLEWRWFSMLGGVRYDHFESGASTSTAGKRFFASAADAVSPRGGITIQPIDELVFFANISQTRTPLLGINRADGSPATNPWRATQYEGGVRINPVGTLWLTLAAYRIEQENVPEFDRAGYLIDNDGRNTSRGAEASLVGNMTENWSFMAMYAYNQYTDRTVAPGSKGRDFERYPAHTFSLNTSYRIASGPLADIVLGFGYRFRSMSYGLMQGKYVNKNVRFNPSHVFDLSMAIPMTKFMPEGYGEGWQLTLGIRNLFGEKYFESARHFYESLVGEPRTFEVGLRATF